MAVVAYEAEFGAPTLPLAATPEQIEVWFGPDMVTETPVVNALGDQLPPVAFSSALLDYYRFEYQVARAAGKKPMMQRQMLEGTVVDPITGCWIPKDKERYLAENCYVPCGDKDSGVTPSGSTVRHRANWQRHNVPLGEEPLTSEDDIDHTCRDGACGQPAGHGKKMDNKTNNDRKEEALDFESALRRGQTMSAHTGKVSSRTGEEWLDPLIEGCNGKFVDAVFVIKGGAYLLERLSPHLVVGKKIPRPLRERLRAPAPYRHSPERIEVHENQMSLNETELYHDLLVRAIQKRRTIQTSALRVAHVLLN